MALSCDKPTIQPRKPDTVKWYEWLIVIAALVFWVYSVAFMMVFMNGGFE